MFGMPRHAPVLECSEEDKATLLAISKSRNEEARAVERARIILGCLEGKEIQQVARESCGCRFRPSANGGNASRCLV
jgi:hypothetical protein